ncbi:MAG: Fe-S cluster assembly protein SufD [candidate division Zixibacteria bacterium]|nr:Fe-S cluster assembly protein SufD [candidate division Zixibacteria bacterium]
MSRSSQKTDTTSEYLIPESAPELLRGPKWLRDARERSRRDFNKSPVPPRGLHLWRYTDPATFLIPHDGPPDSTPDDGVQSSEGPVSEHLEKDSTGRLVHDVGGRDIELHGADALTSRGVIVSRLSEAVDRHRKLVEQYLYRLINSRSGKFEAQNSALWNNGIFIFVPDSVRVAEPIHLLREAGRSGSTQFHKLLIVVGRNAELTVVDEYFGGDDSDRNTSHANSAVEIFGLQESRVRYVSLQRYAHRMNSYLTHRATLERGATMLTVPLDFGGAVSKHNYGVSLVGEGAESNIIGLLFASGRQHFDNHTRHHHAASRTQSNIDFKTVLRDKSTSAYTGLIRIENEAKGCEAYQENRNLLLNRGVRAEVIPELEILNEDVSCTHGATIGPIDPLTIFYLKSRGIEQEAAVRMIVAGFVDSTLKRLPSDVAERVAGFAHRRLEGL